jgi:hypothetical protein
LCQLTHSGPVFFVVAEEDVVFVVGHFYTSDPL